MQEKCKSEANYRDFCFQCGKTGYLAKACGNKPCCMVCASLKLDSDHRVGSVRCKGTTYKEKETHTTNNNYMYKDPNANMYKDVSQKDTNRITSKDGSSDQRFDNKEEMDVE